jgi:hypothetical protein
VTTPLKTWAGSSSRISRARDAWGTSFALDTLGEMSASKEKETMKQRLERRVSLKRGRLFLD